MAYGVLTTGFAAKPLDVIETEMKEGMRSAISPTLNLGSRSLLGQFISVTASQIRQLWEAAQGNYTARDAAQATGDALTSLAELTGAPRDPATYSTALMTITLAAGTYAAGLLKVNVTGDTTKVFVNDASITTAGATLVGVPFTCTTTGPVSAPIGTLVNITTPVTGFSAPTNPADAVLGADVEEDSDLRQRREDQLAIGGSSNVDAVRANLLNNDNVTYATVLENETDSVDANGLPAHSIGPVVEGGTDAEVAAIIFAKKAGGIASYGSTVVVVNDQSGNPHNIGLTRPTIIPITTDISVSYDEDAFESNAACVAAVKAAILAEATKSQFVARDVITQRYSKAVMAIGVGESIVDVTNLQWSNGGAPSSANYVIGPFQRASIVEAQIFVVATAVSGAP